MNETNTLQFEASTLKSRLNNLQLVVSDFKILNDNISFILEHEFNKKIQKMSDFDILNYNKILEHINCISDLSASVYINDSNSITHYTTGLYSGIVNELVDRIESDTHINLSDRIKFICTNRSLMHSNITGLSEDGITGCESITLTQRSHYDMLQIEHFEETIRDYLNDIALLCSEIRRDHSNDYSPFDSVKDRQEAVHKKYIEDIREFINSDDFIETLRKEATSQGKYTVMHNNVVYTCEDSSIYYNLNYDIKFTHVDSDGNRSISYSSSCFLNNSIIDNKYREFTGVIAEKLAEKRKSELDKLKAEEKEKKANEAPKESLWRRILNKLR